MTTTKAAARAFLNRKYPDTASMPLDWAIREARRTYAVEREYFTVINRSHEGEDEAYERMREMEVLQ